MRSLSPGRRFYPAALALLILVTGCSKRSEISFSNQGAVALNDSSGAQPSPQLRLNWIRSPLVPHQGELVLESYERQGPFSTGHSGSVHVDFTLLNHGAPSSTKGTLELPLKEDWGWGVDFFVRDTNPTETCWGCFGSLEFPLDAALGYDPSMKLYVVWGGNSISNPVIY